MIAWSYGGGVQSVAIGVLIRQGALPVPDLAVIADTSRECRSTWDYLREHMQPYLDPVGLKIQIAPHTLAGRDLYGPDGLTLMPAWTAEGRKASFCAGHWKRDVVERWLRLQGVTECDQWIGYSFDEQRRMTGDHRPWCHVRFPLIEKRVTRAACARLIEAAGLPMPRKSRCWMCPHQTPEEWLEVKASPDEFAAAVAVEKAINANDPAQTGLYLYRGRVPLELADFARDHDESIPPLFRPCEGMSCWT